MICILDPRKPQSYVARSFGGGSTATMLSWLRPPVLKNTAPLITNLSPNQVISSPAFTVQGRSRFVNLPITRVFYQLNSGAWQTNTISNLVDWSAPLNPASVLRGVNTLKVYVRNASLDKSQTNRLSFVYDPTASTSFAISGARINGGGAGVQGTNLLIWWPDSPLTWRLEEATRLGPPADWQPCPALPASSGSGWQALVPMSGGTRKFYRLRNP
jgi:hypothetical protein